MAIGTQRITPEEFERFIMLAENTDKRFELIGGEIVEVVSNSYSSECAANILILLGGFVKAHKSGRVTGADGGYIVSGGQYIPKRLFYLIASPIRRMIRTIQIRPIWPLRYFLRQTIRASFVSNCRIIWRRASWCGWLIQNDEWSKFTSPVSPCKSSIRMARLMAATSCPVLPSL
jgi:hypothetical protein